MTDRATISVQSLSLKPGLSPQHSNKPIIESILEMSFDSESESESYSADQNLAKDQF